MYGIAPARPPTANPGGAWHRPSLGAAPILLPATPNIDKAFYTVYGGCGRLRVPRSPEWGSRPIDSDLDFKEL